MDPDEQKTTTAWNSVDDALQVFYSLSKVTRGSISNSPRESLGHGFSSENSKTPSEKSDVQLQEKTSNDNDLVEESCIGGGRGKILRELEKQFSRQQLDEKIHSDLRMVVGPGYSNELIEHYFGSASSSSTCETAGMFSDCDEDNSESQLNVECSVSTSALLKQINESQKQPMASVSKKKKLPRCRNAVILNLIEKKLSKEEVKETKNASPQLKGPDLFLSKKSYSSTLCTGINSSSSSGSSKPIFTEEDFPAL